ncbi:hypothetical protein [Streptomyces sp. PR69]|uniref:hypothetical protein n=1 Tax=Streptomyces sp. PR69 TaxID=2984950 RepID=UPI002263C234|nr:hypothetical protein [Streptomyces sp. PR69]
MASVLLLQLAGGAAEASEIVEALLTAASVRSDEPALAERWRRMADDISSSLDHIRPPHLTQEHTE